MTCFEVGDSGSNNVSHFRYVESEVLFKQSRVIQLHCWSNSLNLDEDYKYVRYL